MKLPEDKYTFGMIYEDGYLHKYLTQSQTHKLRMNMHYGETVQWAIETFDISETQLQYLLYTHR